jgi:hypothetical protein
MQIPKGGFDCGIIMYDESSRITSKNVLIWRRDLTRACESENIPPLVVCGNRIDDINNRQINLKPRNFHQKENLPLLGTSAKSNINIKKPFLLLVRKLRGDKSLYFVGAPSLVLPQNVLKTEVSVGPAPAAASPSSNSPVKNIRRLFGGSPKLRASPSVTNIAMEEKKAKEVATSTKSKKEETEPMKKGATSSKEDEEALLVAALTLLSLRVEQEEQ